MTLSCYIFLDIFDNCPNIFMKLSQLCIKAIVDLLHYTAHLLKILTTAFNCVAHKKTKLKHCCFVNIQEYFKIQFFMKIDK